MPVERHRAAIRRDQLSRPLRSIGRHGYLGGQFTVFDYGCGYGDDVRLLQANGVSAFGWDPYYYPESPTHEADIVNVGYVINVIEDDDERGRVVREAWEKTRVCLLVAAMLRGQGGLGTAGSVERVTERNTYQKYYSQGELRQWVTQVLGEPAIPIAPGVVVVHRDKIAEQRFLLGRHQRPIGEILFSPRGATATPENARAFYEAHQWVLDSLWSEAVSRGRAPTRDEVSAELVDATEGLFRSIGRAVDWLAWYFGPEPLATAAARRRDDLLVTFALETFSGRPRYRDWPAELQQDVKALWRSYKAATQEADQLLFSLGDPDKIAEACQDAAAQGLGHLQDSKSFQSHVSRLSSLPPALRTYVGCAEQLYGDIDEADLVKIHIHSGKLTLLFYDDFSKRIPMLRHRVKILLRGQDMQFFDYGEEYPAQPLWRKSLYMTSDMPDYESQRDFDSKLVELTNLDFSGFGPSWEEFTRRIRELGMQFDGYKLIKT